MKTHWITISFLLALAACSSEAKPPPRAAVAAAVQETPPPAPTPRAPAAPPPAATALKVSDDIRSACGLSDQEARFAYNSSKLRPQDQQFLQKLGDCFSRGPLAKRRIRLVGHADPRGSEQYNFALGRQRAESVKLAMLQRGLSSQQVATESRGKLDATGRDEASWALDRRVEASLLQ